MPSTKVRVGRVDCSDPPALINDEKPYLVTHSAGEGVGGVMATSTLPAVRVPADADLLSMLASLLAAMPGPRLGAPLSQVVKNVCVTCCPDEAADRAVRLESELAEYLHGWRVLRAAEASPAGLDAWAARAPLTFLRAALVACARCYRSGGAR